MADGSIVIDTSIDTEGASAGYNKLIAEVRKLNRDMEVLNKNSKLTNIQQQLDYTREKSNQLENQLQELRQTQKALEAKAQLINSDETQKQLAKVNAAIKKNEDKLVQYGDKCSLIENDIVAQTAKEETKRANINDKLTIAKQKIAEMAVSQNAVPTMTDKMSAAMERFERRVKGLVKRVLIFSVITAALRLLKNYIGKTLKTVEPFNQALGRLKGALMTAFQPILQVAIPIITALTNALAIAFGWLARLINALMGKSAVASAKSAKALNAQSEALDGVSSSAKDAEKSLAGFDTINALSSSTGTASGSVGVGSADFSEMEQASKWTEKFERAMQAIKKIIDVLKPAFQNFNEHILKPFLAICGKIADVVGEVLVSALENFATWVEENKEEVQQFIEILLTIGLVVGIVFLITKAVKVLTGILSIIPGAMWLITSIGKILVAGIAAIPGIISGVIGFAKPLIAAFGSFIIGIIKGVMAFFTSTVGLAILGIVSLSTVLIMWAGNGEEALGYLKGAFSNLLDFIVKVFTGDFEGAFKSLGNFFINILNLLIVAIESFVNFAIEAFNWVLKGAVKLANKLPGVNINIDAVGFGKIELPRIPALAKGAVIPPNAPFMAMLGDQKSGTNIETPLETMIEAFKHAQGTQAINIKFTGTLAQLGRVLKPVIDKENTRIGTSLVKKGV